MTSPPHDDDQARHHAGRAAMYWVLAEIVGSPLRPVDLETIRAMLETVEVPDPLAQTWADLRGAFGRDDPELLRLGTYSAVPVLPRSWARDLRVLSLRNDDASRGLQSGTHLVPRDVQSDLRLRLGIAAEALQLAAGFVYPAAGRAIAVLLSLDPHLGDRIDMLNPLESLAS
ncbi:MAG: hypothetical protein IT379_12355 [Deltaproteobacteria bacterium]|nr:hypothetical protein [Deltaproteobacteria bacterium]